MLTLLGMLLPLLSNLISPIFKYFGTKEQVTLGGLQASVAADATVDTAMIQASAQMAAVKAEANTWIGARIISGTIGEMGAVYVGSLILDSMFHFHWNIAKLPSPWDQFLITALGSYFIIPAVAPVFTATSSWLRTRQ